MAREKVDRLKSKLKTNKNDRIEVKVVAREVRAIGSQIYPSRMAKLLLLFSLTVSPR